MNKSLIIGGALCVALLAASFFGFWILIPKGRDGGQVMVSAAGYATERTGPESPASSAIPDAADQLAPAPEVRPDPLQEERLRQAEEAAHMARQMAAQEQQRHREEMERLNRLLEAEASARMRAEEAARELESRMQQIQNELSVTHARQLEILRQQQEARDSVDSRAEAVAASIAESNRALQAFQEERDRLLREREQRFQKQMELEREIIERGGEITMSGYRRVWSPNYRPFGTGRD